MQALAKCVRDIGTSVVMIKGTVTEEAFQTALQGEYFIDIIQPNSWDNLTTMLKLAATII